MTASASPRYPYSVKNASAAPLCASAVRAAVKLTLTLMASSAHIGLAVAQTPQTHVPATKLSTLSLEQLLEVSIVGASKYEQKQSEVAAAVSVITRQEIKAFGWRTLAEALASLPGVHTTYDRQYNYIGTRGFRPAR